MNLTFSTSNPEMESARLREMVIYVSKACARAPNFGLMKLNKILWKSDFLTFARLRVPLTGSEYQKLKNGPAPRMIQSILSDLKSDGSIRIELADTPWGTEHKKVIALRDPDLSGFSCAQMVMVDEAIRMHWNLTAAETSIASHGRAWDITELHELIPYEAAYISDEEVTEADIERAHKLAAHLCWDE